jgi:AraC family ethanolamine operon transcriptional activator
MDPECPETLEQAAERRLLPAPSPARDTFAGPPAGLAGPGARSPWLLEHPGAVNTIEQDLLDWLVGTIRPPEGSRARPQDRLRQRSFSRAIAHLREADLASPYCSELRRITEVSRRTLEYAFREQIGLSPMELLRRLRLHAVRRALHAAESGDATVAQIAAAQGFYHPGRFAAEDRTTFGEYPSVRLNRAYRFDAGRV